MSQPTFSIITVTYNAEKVLERTIISIINQTETDFEFILVDGLSKDGTMRLVEKYKSHIHQVVSEKDRGIYDAMNKGIALAKGDFVWFMNAGDEIAETNTIAKMKQQLRPGTDLIYGDAWFVNMEGVKRGLRSQLTPHKLPSSLKWVDFKHGMLICHQSFIAKKTIVEKYDISNLSADLDYEINAVKASKSQLFINEPISLYLEGGISNQQLKKSLWDRFKVIKKHFGLVGSIAAHLYILFRGMKKIVREGKYW